MNGVSTSTSSSETDSAETDQEPVCSICLETDNLIAACDDCTNQAHLECIQTSIRKGHSRCPICQKEYQVITRTGSKRKWILSLILLIVMSIGMATLSIFFGVIDPSPNFNATQFEKETGVPYDVGPIVFGTFLMTTGILIYALWLGIIIGGEFERKSKVSNMAKLHAILTIPGYLLIGVIVIIISKMTLQVIPQPYDSNWVIWYKAYYLVGFFYLSFIFVIGAIAVFAILICIGCICYAKDRLISIPDEKRYVVAGREIV